MSATQYYVAQTLDGCIAERDGGLEWLLTYGTEDTPEDAEGGPSGATEGAYDRFYEQVGVVAMGSATYEWVLAHVDAWPYDDVPAWVFSSRDLPAPPGDDESDVRFVSSEVAPAHAEMLAAARERNVWLVGGGDLASQFVEAGLLDEVLVTIVPVWLGDGLPTFARRISPWLRRTGTTPFANGMTELRYAVER